MRRVSCCVRRSSMAFVVLTAFWCSASQAQTLIHFDLPAQSLAESLKAIGTATKTDIGFSSNQVAGLRAPALKADLTVDGALTRVLSGTGLRLQHVRDHVIVLVAVDSSAADSTPNKSDPSGVVYSTGASEAAPPTRNEVEDLSKVGFAQPDPSSPSDTPTTTAGERRKELEEVVVTGTHIRGVTDTASPLTVYSREDIDQSGAGSLNRFLATISQNLNNTSAINVSNVAGGAGNTVAGTGVNLRGLGSDSTLVLVNGRRLAPGDLTGDYVDVSMIPVAAIDHIDLMTDGASAIYGSDAVGGVVNIILRQHFDGLETRLNYGTVTQGGDREMDVGQTFGQTWGSGSALVSYEYVDQTPLGATDRDYAQTATEPFTLIPSQIKQSVYGTISQSLAPSVSLFADGLYSQRATSGVTATVTSQDFSTSQPSDTRTYSVTGGARTDAFSGAQAELSASYAASHTNFSEFDHLTNLVDNAEDIHSNVLSVDAKLDGKLVDLPSGPALFAVGAQFRKESLNELDQVFSTDYAADRRVSAGFVELHIPLIAPAAACDGGIGKVDLELANRYEHYSDFGSSNNPKVGLIWNSPIGLKVHGTYGTSFKAPLLDNMNPIPTQTLILPIPDPSNGATTNTLFLSGGNPNLTPEKARTWTIGFDLKPAVFDRLTFTANYFHIKYDDRITLPQYSVGPYDVLTDAALLGSLVQRNPSVAFLQQLVNSAVHFYNIPNVPLSQVGAFVDYRYQNLSSVITDGVDFSLSYHWTTPVGELETGLNGTKLMKVASQILSTTPAIDILNTPYNPIGLRFRAKSGLTYGKFALSAFVNYTNSYVDNRQTEPVPIASWMTIDLATTYAVGVEGGALHDTIVTLSVLNVADRPPPFVQNLNFTDSGINFDGVNANPLGRYISLQLSKHW